MIFKRALLHELAAASMGTLAVLIGILLTQRLAFYLGSAVNGTLASEAIGALLGFSLLRFLPSILSLTLFLATLLTLTRWYRDHEMVVWFSAGLNLTAWIRPVLTFALPLILIIGLLSLFVTPWATSKSMEFRQKIESRGELSYLTPGVFKESKTVDRVFFIESFDALGTAVKNIFVQSHQNGKVGVMVAHQGFRAPHDNGENFIALVNGSRYEGIRGSPEFSIMHFDRYEIRLDPDQAPEYIPTTQSQSSLALLKMPAATARAEIQWRFSLPISTLILVLLAIPLSHVDHRTGRSANMIGAVLIFIIYNNAISIAQAWIIQGKINPSIGLWPIHGLFLTLTLWVFYRRSQLRPIIPGLTL